MQVLGGVFLTAPPPPDAASRPFYLDHGEFSSSVSTCIHGGCPCFETDPGNPQPRPLDLCHASFRTPV